MELLPVAIQGKCYKEVRIGDIRVFTFILENPLLVKCYAVGLKFNIFCGNKGQQSILKHVKASELKKKSFLL